MRKKFRRSVSAAAIRAPQFGGLALIALLLTIILYRFEVVATDAALKLTAMSGVFALTGLGLAIKGLSDLWRHGDKGGRASIKGMILSMITLAPCLLAAAVWFVLPPSYDVSSDFDNPPLYPSETRPDNALPLKDNFMDQADWSDLRGRRYEISSDNILTAIEAVMEEKGWDRRPEMNSLEDAENLKLAVLRLPVLGFSFDALIRIKDEDEATQVDMRVAARDLPYDFGFGAHMIDSFMQALDREVLLSALEAIEED